MMNSLVWHYTTRVLLDAICKSGEIAPDGLWKHVWFSANETAEPTVVQWESGTPYIRNRRIEDGIGRIAVPETFAPLNWSSIRPRIIRSHAERLEEEAKELGGNTNDWRLSATVVGRGAWSKVQVWTPAGWSSYFSEI
jgi:hypothetical protein